MASSSSAPPPVNIPSGEASSSAPAPAPPQPAVNEASSSSPPPPDGKILTLKSSDELEFQVEESIAVQSGTIKNMVEDGYTVIPLLNVESKTLIKVLDYMMKHAGASEEGGTNKEELEEFDKEFVNISFKSLSQLVFAANYLHIAGLMNLLCQTIADKIKNKTVNAVRRIFNVTNDYTQEEEDEVRREHDWAHEGEYDDTVFEDDVSEDKEEGESDGDDNDDGASEEGAEVVGGSGNAGEIEEIDE